MVLVILFERTSPTRSFLWPRATTGAVAVIVSGIGNQSGRFAAKLAHTGLDARDVPAQGAQAGRLLELAAGLLEAQVENLLPQIAALGAQFGHRQIFKFRYLHNSLRRSTQAVTGNEPRLD